MNIFKSNARYLPNVQYTALSALVLSLALTLGTPLDAFAKEKVHVKQSHAKVSKQQSHSKRETKLERHTAKHSQRTPTQKTAKTHLKNAKPTSHKTASHAHKSTSQHATQHQSRSHETQQQATKHQSRSHENQQQATKHQSRSHDRQQQATKHQSRSHDRQQQATKHQSRSHDRQQQATKHQARSHETQQAAANGRSSQHQKPASYDIPASAGMNEQPVNYKPNKRAGPLQVGTASYYSDKFDGGRTASGERFDQGKLTCAHSSLPFGCRIRVTNLHNNKTVDVKVNDRGGFSKHGRMIDLSKAAAREIGMVGKGTAKVKVEVID